MLLKAKECPDIIKVDRCFYAPLLNVSLNGEEYWKSLENGEKFEEKTEYIPYLSENHPQAYRYLIDIIEKNGVRGSANVFWKNYHDADVEQEF